MQRAPQAVGRVYFFRNSVYFFLFIRSPFASFISKFNVLN